MIILQDTREKVGHKNHILKYFEKHNIQVVRQKLNVGDYCIKGKDNVVIDLKQNILEIASNMFCDKVRFEKECIRAKNKNILLIFLIEEKFDKDKLLKWKAPLNVKHKRFLNVHGWQIFNEIKRYIVLFGVKFRCCHKNSTGKTIVDILIKENGD